MIAMFSRTSLYFNAMLAVLVLITTIFALPYTASAIYLYRGTSKIESWMESNGFQPGSSALRKIISTSLPTDSSSVGEIVAAREDLDQAIRWDSRNGKARIALAYAYLLLQDYTSASQTLDQYQVALPEDAVILRDIHTVIGNAVAAKGNFQHAWVEWTRAGLAVDIQASTSLANEGMVRMKAADFADEVDKKYLRESDGRIAMLLSSSLSKTLFFPESGNYTLVLRGKNDVPGPVDLVVEIDGVSAPISFDANDDSWAEKTIKLTIQSGAHSLIISFLNDYFGPVGDRNAELEWVEVRAP